MNEGLFQFILTAFITLTVVVDPFGLIPVFIGLTGGQTVAQRTSTLLRSVGVAFGVSLFFLILGKTALHYLGVTVQAFGISGGILLFITAMPMLFGTRPGTMSPTPNEDDADTDVAIFPLGIPLLAGPGTITAVLLLAADSHADPFLMFMLGLTIAAVFVFTIFILSLGEKLFKRLGEGGLHIGTRVMGLVVAAMAVQFVMNGFTGYYNSLVSP